MKFEKPTDWFVANRKYYIRGIEMEMVPWNLINVKWFIETMYLRNVAWVIYEFDFVMKMSIDLYFINKNFVYFNLHHKIGRNHR